MFIKFSQTLADKLKKTWMRLVLRGVHYSDNYKKLNAFYLVDDPWRMSDPSEIYRFTETNRLIIENFGRVDTLLEIGCGEGHQSLYLRQVCDRMIGLDVSARAVERARSRCPQDEFLIGDIFSKEVDDLTPFDLVVANEVLYSMIDTPEVLQRMQKLSRNNFVTYHSGQMANLDPQVLSLSGVNSEIIEFKDTRWRATWWCNDQV